ncbi:MAG: EamA family transporter, partial [Sphingomicrobium sp.]
MKSVEPTEFERNCADGAGAPDVFGKSAIRSRMNRTDWLILGALAVIWGGAFFLIGVAVRDVPPLTYVWLRLTIAAAAMWLFVWVRRIDIGLPRDIWGPII